MARKTKEHNQQTTSEQSLWSITSTTVDFHFAIIEHMEKPSRVSVNIVHKGRLLGHQNSVSQKNDKSGSKTV
jgi:hypothetical protein